MDRIWPIITITFKEGIRNRAIQGIMVIAVLLCFAYLSVIPMFAFETGKVMVDLGGASANLAGLVIVIFLSISMLARDIHQRSICMILSRPISRQGYVLGKFSGMALMVLTAILLVVGMAVIASLIGLRFVAEMDAPRNFAWHSLALAVGFDYLSLLILLSFAFLFTMVTTNEYLSMLLTFIMYVIGHSLETFVKVATMGSDIKVSAFYIDALKSISWILPNLSAFDLKLHLAYGLPIPVPQAAWTAVYGICYVATMVALTMFIFNRKEIR